MPTQGEHPSAVERPTLELTDRLTGGRSLWASNISIDQELSLLEACSNQGGPKPVASLSKGKCLLPYEASGSALYIGQRVAQKSDDRQGTDSLLEF
jgi:hypothetical protein